MGYVTHQFANTETLDRARRWLVHAGFDPSQIETITMGAPRIAVRVGSGEAAEASLIIDAAELSDPHGNPSFWDLRGSVAPEPDRNLRPDLRSPR